MVEPISIEDARRQCRIDGSDEDAHLADLISRARGWVESYTGRLLVNDLYTRQFDSFARGLQILGGPVIEVTEITYLDRDGIEGEWTDFRVISSAQVTRIEPNIGTWWPTVGFGSGVISVTFLGGYEPQDVPPPLRSAMLLLIGEMYANREGLSEAAFTAAENLCRAHRVMIL